MYVQIRRMMYYSSNQILLSELLVHHYGSGSHLQK